MNPLDRKIVVGGAEYTARPDFEAMVNIEAGRDSIVDMLNRFVMKAPKMTDIARIVHACVVSGEAPRKVPDLHSFGQAMAKEPGGIMGFAVVAAELLSGLTAGEEKKKDAP